MIVATNKKARFEYFIEDTFEAGIELKGSEVKSIRDGGLSLAESFVMIDKDEVFLKNCYIKPYRNSASYIPEERRNRKLLLHRREINKLATKVKEKGYTLVAEKVYFKDGKVKVQIALALGKKLYDKRESLKKDTIKREIESSINRMFM